MSEHNHDRNRERSQEELCLTSEHNHDRIEKDLRMVNHFCKITIKGQLIIHPNTI